MSDSDEGNEAGVPSWQLNAKVDPAERDDESPTEEPSRATVIEQAKKFLEEDEVRNSTTDKKIAFLESKGLRSDEIQDLLGISRDLEASSPAVEPQAPIQTARSPPIHSTPPPPQQTAPSQPPIITYPEFLINPTSPSPLITKTRLLTTLYLFSGLSALLYGANTYLITPMVEQLTKDRLDLAQTASAKLQELNSKLEGMVSEIPTTILNHGIPEADQEDVESDGDPTEMFHRDIGVQTSPPTSPSASRPGSPKPDSSEATIDKQTSRLTSLKLSLQGLIDDSASEGHDVTELEGTIGILKDFLDSMAYVQPQYGYSNIVGGFNGAGGYGGSKEADDEISKVKAGIRGVKGVLLSARSFPGGVRAGGK